MNLLATLGAVHRLCPRRRARAAAERLRGEARRQRAAPVVGKIGRELFSISDQLVVIGGRSLRLRPEQFATNALNRLKVELVALFSTGYAQGYALILGINREGAEVSGRRREK